MSGLYDNDAYAAAIFDVADDFLARRRVNGPRPRPLGPIRFKAVSYTHLDVYKRQAHS